jgi:hypothetical protein
LRIIESAIPNLKPTIGSQDASCENLAWAFRCSQLRDNPQTAR